MPPEKEEDLLLRIPLRPHLRVVLDAEHDTVRIIQSDPMNDEEEVDIPLEDLEDVISALQLGAERLRPTQDE